MNATTNDRIIECRVHPDPEIPVVPMRCETCGRTLPCVPGYGLGHCTCGAHDWTWVPPTQR